MLTRRLPATMGIERFFDAELSAQKNDTVCATTYDLFVQYQSVRMLYQRFTMMAWSPNASAKLGFLNI